MLLPSLEGWPKARVGSFLYHTLLAEIGYDFGEFIEPLLVPRVWNHGHMLCLVRRVLGKTIGDLLDRTGEWYGGGNNLVRPIGEIDRHRRAPRKRPGIAPVPFAGHADRFPGPEKRLDRAIVKRDHAVPHIGILRREAGHARLTLQCPDQNRRHPDLGTRQQFRILNPVQFPRIGETLTFEQGQDDMERLLKAADIPLEIKAIRAMLGREITGPQAENETAVTQGAHIIRRPGE